MSFNNLFYLGFLFAVVVLYWCVPRRLQNPLLLLISYYFLGAVHPWFCLLIFFVSMVNFLGALAIQHYPHSKQWIVRCCLLLSLGNLAIFKYFDFFLDNFQLIFSCLGLRLDGPALSILLPVGISFYTFQALAYTIDVYRGKIEPVASLIDFLLFISFFPQLVAGPIERSAHLMPQITGRRSIKAHMVQQGIMLLCWGFFKKLVIADNTGMIVEKVFALSDPSFFLVWAGIIAFSVQILADFWSYTDIARGSALLLGFRLSRNFDHPYFSASPAEFWRRWHMSLSYWLRDYVYIPLGGSRKGAGRRALNIMITFLLSGLWHGASWNFVLWGGYHGVLVLIQAWCRNIFSPFSLSGRGEKVKKLVKIVMTYALITFGWLFFRVTDMQDLVLFLRLSPLQAPPEDLKIAFFLCLLTLLYALPMIVHGLVYFTDLRLRGEQNEYAPGLLFVRPVVAAVLVLGILTLRSPQPAAFIYFQF